MPEEHLIGVHRQDFPLRVPLFDLKGEQQLLDLALPRLVQREKEVARELHGDRARATALLVEDVADGGDRDPYGAHTEVAVEAGIFGRDDRLAQPRRDLLVGDDDASLRGEPRHHFAVGRQHPRDGAGCVVIQGADLGEVADEGEQDTTDCAEDRRADEHDDEAGLTGDADDVASHRNLSARIPDPDRAASMHRHATNLDALKGHDAL